MIDPMIKFKPRDAIYYHNAANDTIPAIVVRRGHRRIKIKYSDSTKPNGLTFCWVKPENCDLQKENQ